MNNLENRVWTEGMYRSRQRATAAACRIAGFLAQHGRLPDANEYLSVIEPLRDPMNGELMRYRAQGDGFVVYSVGANGRDDGGKDFRDCTEGEESYDDFVSEFTLPR